MLAKLRPKLTYANVLSTLCLFILLGGSSYAAVTLKRNAVKNRHIAKNAVTSPKVKNASLLAQDFAPGQLPAGPQGPQGPQGAPGAAGANGSALLTGQRPLPTSGTVLAPVNGGTPPTPDVDDSASLIPNRTLTARNLAARTRVDIPAGTSLRVAFVENPPGDFGTSNSEELACTITGTAGAEDKACTAPGPISLAPGAMIFMKITSTGTTSAGRAFWGVTVEP